MFEITAETEIPIPHLSFQPAMKILADYDQESATVLEVAMKLNVLPRTIYRWIEEGVTLDRAEIIADKIGVHPVEVWGSEYHIAVYMAEIAGLIRLKKKELQHQKNILRSRIYKEKKKQEKQSSGAN